MQSELFDQYCSQFGHSSKQFILAIHFVFGAIDDLD